MARTHEKQKGRATYADFIGIPRKVADSPAFRSLPPIARALYVDLRRQHNGFNNGQIAAVDKGTGERPGLAYYGWPHSSVHKNLKLLLEHGLIEKTRQGGIGAMSRTCSLYAFADLLVVGNPQKGIRGAQASLAYLSFKPNEQPEPSREKVEGPQRGPIGASEKPVKVHLVTSTGFKGT